MTKPKPKPKSKPVPVIEPDEEEIDCHEDEDNHTLIRAKWTIDGAKTLKECAELLRAFASELEQMDKDGWKLEGEVQDDYGFLHKDCPNHASTVSTMS